MSRASYSLSYNVNNDNRMPPELLAHDYCSKQIWGSTRFHIYFLELLLNEVNKAIMLLAQHVMMWQLFEDHAIIIYFSRIYVLHFIYT
mmetsp:Transcript_106/g.184  ORF Transcript_106/g.184 Transcript_106/m.184 type:complete len:88 (+) Transcript_106:513-776(+)